MRMISTYAPNNLADNMLRIFLNYINLYSYYFNKFFLRYIIKPYLLFFSAFVVMMSLSVGVFLISDAEWVLSLWTIILFFGSIFTAITWIVRHEKPETKVLADSLGISHDVTEKQGLWT